MSARRRNSIVASPVLVGTVTTLITVVAVFLSYNANTGLPFVPTYEVRAHVPDAQGLIRGNEVRVGGKRVGIVGSVRAVEDARGRPAAELLLMLEPKIRPLRDDSEITVRPRSPLGLKYLELIPGRRGRAVEARGMLPARAAQPTVELDEALNAFDAASRRALGGAVEELGTGLAGRGDDVNALLAAAPPLLREAEDVARAVGDPGARLGRLVAGGGRVGSELAAAAPSLRPLVEAADTTAGALHGVRGELGEALDELPPTLAAGDSALAAARPLLADARVLVADLRPAGPLLRPASERLHAALAAGTPVLRRAVALAGRLERTLTALERLATDPHTHPALRRLLATVRSLRPTVEYVVPAQTVCNSVSLWVRNLASTTAEGDLSGTWVRTLPVGAADEVDPSVEPAPELHVNMYPNQATPGQPLECEAGREPYLPGQQIGNPPGNQGTDVERTRSPLAGGAP